MSELKIVDFIFLSILSHFHFYIYFLILDLELGYSMMSRSQEVDFVYFIFLSHFYFSLNLLFIFSIFRTVRVRVRSNQSHCHISHNLMVWSQHWSQDLGE